MKVKDIQKTICLSHDSRKANRKYIQNLCKRVGLDVEFFTSGNGKDTELKYDRLDLYEPKQTSINICQKCMVANASEKGYDNILMLEDDVTFTKDFVEVLDMIDLPEDWAGINLGGYSEYPRIAERYYHMEELLLICNRMWGLFGTLVNSRSFGWFLSYNPEAPGQSSLDNTLSNKSNDNEYMLTKPIIVERPGVSANLQVYKESPLYNQAKRENRLWVDVEITSDLFPLIKFTNYSRRPPNFLYRRLS